MSDFGIQKGSIVEFDSQIGIGSIKTDKDEILFFHIRTVLAKQENIQPGIKAVFEVIPGRQGRLEAQSIHLL